MEEILKKINEAIEQYEQIPLEDIHAQSELLRTITCNLFYLEGIRSEYHAKWHHYYSKSHFDSNVGKEKEADRLVPELYLLRRVLTSGYKVADAIRSTISINKKENG